MEIKWKGALPHNIEVREKGGVVYLSYPALEGLKIVRHGFSTRLGGTSKGIWKSMNLGFGRGDQRENVEENFKRIAQAIGFRYENMVTSNQTHTTNVRKITEEDRGNGIVRERKFHDVDGMVTNVPGVVLTTFYADCVPLYFVDPVRKAVGLSHSGWRGTVSKIGKVTVELMEEQYGSNPSDILAAVGPSICQECYEVSEDVIEQFKLHYKEEFWGELFYRKENGRYQLNLWRANELVFLEAGIKQEHIAVTNLCTHCNSEILYSHRTAGDKRGNLCAFLALREKTE